MGYINYKLLYQKDLSDKDFHLLQKIFQKEETLLEAFLDRFEYLEGKGLIQYLKGQENTAKGVRISKKGKALLSQLESAEYTDNIGILLDKLVELYASNQKHIGTKLEVKNRLIWFMSNTGFSSSVIFNCVDEYLTDNPEFTKSLENLLWTPASKAFSTHKNLKDSKLFDFICQKYKLDETFYINGNHTKEVKWLQDISMLELPKRLDSDLYFTGSYESDLEHKEKIKSKYLKKIKL